MLSVLTSPFSEQGKNLYMLSLFPGVIALSAPVVGKVNPPRTNGNLGKPTSRELTTVKPSANLQPLRKATVTTKREVRR